MFYIITFAVLAALVLFVFRGRAVAKTPEAPTPETNSGSAGAGPRDPAGSRNQVL